MPQLRSLLSSPHAGLVVRIAAAAALIVGLLGMHVLLSPTAHAAHGAGAVDVSATTSVGAGAGTTPHHAHVSVGSASEPTLRSPAEPGCAGACTTAAPSDHGSLHAPESGVWAVVCVLALLLTAVLAARRGRPWQLAWHRVRQVAPAERPAASRAPQHPPSLTELSISRT